MKPLIERMTNGGAAKAWIKEVEAKDREIERLGETKDQYLNIINLLACEKEQLEAGNEQHKRAWVGLKDLCDRASEYDWPTGYMYIGNVRQALDFAILAAEEEDDGPPTVLTSEGLETTAGQWEKG